MRSALRLVLVALLLAGCAARGQITVDPAARSVGDVVPILVATSRAPSTDGTVFGPHRSPALSFAWLGVSVPPDRALGTITFPGTGPDASPNPRTDFLTIDADALPDDRAFLAAINADMARRRPGERRVFVFVHGFNTNFAEGVYRQAQMMHDFATPALGVNYAWPSAADARLYLYDRDSAFFGRDGLERTLRLLATTRAERIVVVAHSMGAQTTLEALRQMALTGAPAFFDKLNSVALLSPDVDVDLFRAEVAPLAERKIPWFIFVSGNDRALRFSSLLRGNTERLGSLVDPSALAGLDVTVIDMSGVEAGDSLGHSAVANSPVMISLVQGLSRYGPTILRQERARVGLAATTASVVAGVTDVVVAPLAGVSVP